MSAPRGGAPTLPGGPSGIGVAEVLGIASEVWLALIGDAALPSAAPTPPMPDDAVRAWVTIEGPWRGRVQLLCAPATAEAMSRAVLGEEPDAPLDAEDVADVLGELANVVGGAVKSLVPGSQALGLPTVITNGAEDAGADGPLVLHVDLAWRDQPVCFSLRGLPAHDLPPAHPQSTDTARGETA